MHRIKAFMRFICLVIGVYLVLHGLILILNTDTARHQWWLKVALQRTQKQLGIINNHLRMHHKSTGSYPTNDEGLLGIPTLVKNIQDNYVEGLETDKIGILGIWGEPFIYENRKGIDNGKFADSGATIDLERNYSIQVDKNIYVWSRAAQEAFSEYKVLQFKLIILRVFLVILGISLILIYFISIFRSTLGEDRKTRITASIMRDGLLMILILSIIATTQTMTTCYAMSRHRGRNPKADANHLKLMSKYHDRGIISDTAYQKIIDSTKSDNN